MDPLVLGLAALSAACFLAFALWPRSSPGGQLGVVRAAEGDRPVPAHGKAPEPVATTVVDNAPAAQVDGLVAGKGGYGSRTHGVSLPPRWSLPVATPIERAHCTLLGSGLQSRPPPL